ncbi:MAG: hypothetical protein AAGC86_07940 [Pseudomonadota bacterium]
MKKTWAIICVVGYAAFWTFGFLALAGFFGDRTNAPINYVMCLVGLGVGTYARFKIMALTPKMRGRRAAARARMEEEYEENLG